MFVKQAYQLRTPSSRVPKWFCATCMTFVFMMAIIQELCVLKPFQIPLQHTFILFAKASLLLLLVGGTTLPKLPGRSLPLPSVVIICNKLPLKAQRKLQGRKKYQILWTVQGYFYTMAWWMPDFKGGGICVFFEILTCKTLSDLFWVEILFLNVCIQQWYVCVYKGWLALKFTWVCTILRD